MLRAVTPTDPLSAPEESGQVTFGGCVPLSLLLPDTWQAGSTEGKILMFA